MEPVNLYPYAVYCLSAYHPPLYPAADIQIIFRNRLAPDPCPLFLANTRLRDLGALARSRESFVIVIERLLEV